MQPMDEIYQKYARTVYRYLLSRTRDEDLAEELDRSHSVIESAEDQVINSMKYVELMKSLHVCPEPFVKFCI